MKDLLDFVDKLLNRPEPDKSEVIIIYCILSLLWNLTDKMSLVPMFVNVDYVKLTVRWLQKFPYQRLHIIVNNAIINIVYNLTRNEEGLEALEKANTFKILMERKVDITNMDNDDLTDTFGMLLIALCRGEVEQKQNEDLIFKVGMSLFDNAKEASKRSDWRHDGCHLSEYLYSLQLAFSNTLVVQHILNDSSNKKNEKVQFFPDPIMFCVWNNI